MEIQEFDPNVHYPSLLDSYKAAMEKDLELRFTEFCRNNGVSNTAFIHWLNRRGMTVTGIRHEVRERLGVIGPKVAPQYEGLPPRKLYEAIWADYKAAIVEDRSLRLSNFCKSRGVITQRMEKWMRRNNLSVIDAKMDVDSNDSDLILMNETLRKRFRLVLEKYKEALQQNHYLSLKDHCANTHTDLHQFRRWLSYNGISVRMIRTAARSRAYFAANKQRVQIQFTPNGLGLSEKLRNVTIRLTDGSCIIMDKCTVVDLCAFVVSYNQSCAKSNKNK